MKRFEAKKWKRLSGRQGAGKTENIVIVLLIGIFSIAAASLLARPSAAPIGQA